MVDKWTNAKIELFGIETFVYASSLDAPVVNTPLIALIHLVEPALAKIGINVIASLIRKNIADREVGAHNKYLV